MQSVHKGVHTPSQYPMVIVAGARAHCSNPLHSRYKQASVDRALSRSFSQRLRDARCRSSRLSTTKQHEVPQNSRMPGETSGARNDFVAFRIIKVTTRCAAAIRSSWCARALRIRPRTCGPATSSQSNFSSARRCDLSYG